MGDMTQAEWEAMYLGGYKHIATHTKQAERRMYPDMKDLPASIDWREKGAITAVKNQGACGSCWAFGTTEQIESYTAIATGELVELSAQQVTSCTPNPLTCGGTGGSNWGEEGYIRLLREATPQCGVDST